MTILLVLGGWAGTCVSWASCAKCCVRNGHRQMPSPALELRSQRARKAVDTQHGHLAGPDAEVIPHLSPTLPSQLQGSLLSVLEA